MNLINKILSKISLSVLATNKNSTPRIQSYIILIPILIMSLVFLFIEVWDFAYIMYAGDGNYKISTEIIVIFGMLLSHHLALIFSRKNSQSISEITGINNVNESINNEEIIEEPIEPIEPIEEHNSTCNKKEDQ